jgi:hypothetical protein
MAESLPWASGSGEILKHGLSLLEKDSDTNRRLAMISIDNSVELMIKTFLGLPKRISSLQISRAEYQEISESFPKLIDAVEKHAADKLTGINLGEIEWYHRLRNQLYHQGNGLTVERAKVEVYAKLAETLFLNLFGTALVRDKYSKHDLLGEFIVTWANLEKTIVEKLEFDRGSKRIYNPSVIVARLAESGVISKSDAQQFDSIRRVRNTVVHGAENYKKLIKPEMTNFLKCLAETVASVKTKFIIP